MVGGAEWHGAHGGLASSGATGPLTRTATREGRRDDVGSPAEPFCDSASSWAAQGGVNSCPGTPNPAGVLASPGRTLCAAAPQGGAGRLASHHADLALRHGGCVGQCVGVL